MYMAELPEQPVLLLWFHLKTLNLERVCQSLPRSAKAEPPDPVAQWQAIGRGAKV